MYTVLKIVKVHKFVHFYANNFFRINFFTLLSTDFKSALNSAFFDTHFKYIYFHSTVPYFLPTYSTMSYLSHCALFPDPYIVLFPLRPISCHLHCPTFIPLRPISCPLTLSYFHPTAPYFLPTYTVLLSSHCALFSVHLHCPTFIPL